MAKKKSKKKRPASKGKTYFTDFAKNLTVVESDLGNSMLLFEQSSQNVYVLNTAAKIIWVSFTNGTTLDDIVDQLLVWFTGGLRDALVRHTQSLLQEFENANLILPLADPKAGFPVGQVVGVSQSTSNVRYDPPAMTQFSKDYLKQNHPGLFNPVNFRDTWGLSVDIA